LESVPDPAAGVVRAEVEHFSTYQALASTAASAPASGASADAAFVLRDAYVYPDPATRGDAPNFHLEVGVADKVELRIYNVAGQEVHRVTITDAPRVVSDDEGADYAYEYSWRGHIPSGVYLFVFQAKKSGHGEIRESGKFSVVR
jgi:hypothetical protein